MTTIHPNPSTSSFNSSDDLDVYSHSNAGSYGPQISPSFSTHSFSHSRTPSQSSRKSSLQNLDPTHRRTSSTSTITAPPAGRRSRARAFSFLLDLPTHSQQEEIKEEEMDGIELNPFENSEYDDALAQESESDEDEQEEEERLARAAGAERRFSYLTPKFQKLSRVEILWMGLSAFLVATLASSSILVTVYGRVK